MVSETTSRRVDPRYVERSEDLSDWIQVRLAEQFGEQREANGLLCDLTPRAVRIAFPGSDEGPPNFSIGTQALLVFRFRNLATVTATATLMRQDRLEHGVGMVFYFDYIREADRNAVTSICTSFNKSRDEVE